jgi:hypothetical protein
MARSDRHTSTDRGRIKLRFIDLEVDGTPASLEQTIRSLVATLTKDTGAQKVVPKAIPATLTSGEPVEEPAVEEPEGEAETEPTTNGNSERRSTPRPIQKPNLLNDLDVISGPVSLKAFYEEKKPVTHWDRYLVIAYWLKTQRSITQINIHHVFTCLRSVGETNILSDVSAPFREMKSKKSYFSSGSPRGHWVITHIGENVVLEMGKAG